MNKILSKAKKIKASKYSLPAAIVIAGILVAGAIIYVNGSPLSRLSPQAAADKALAFINENIQEGATASVVGISEEKVTYKINLKIILDGNEQSYESYITKDGNFLFPSGIDLRAVTAQEEAAATETPEEPAQAQLEEPAVVASESFAKCLTEKGMKFYGSKKCSWCAKEKTLFGAALQYIDYVECVADDGQWAETCQDAQITSVPTWQMPDGTREPGYKTLEQLAVKSGCSL
jgi:hypothetical protein